MLCRRSASESHKRYLALSGPDSAKHLTMCLEGSLNKDGLNRVLNVKQRMGGTCSGSCLTEVPSASDVNASQLSGRDFWWLNKLHRG